LTGRIFLGGRLWFTIIPAWEVTLARNLMSDHEWALFEGFIRAVRRPNKLAPADHGPVLDGIFWSEA